MPFAARLLPKAHAPDSFFMEGSLASLEFQRGADGKVHSLLVRQPGADETALRSPSVTLHAALALILLVGATVLAIYKPRGLTARGRRAQARTMQPATRPLSS